MPIRMFAVVVAVVALLAGCSVGEDGALSSSGSSGPPSSSSSSGAPSVAVAPANATPVAPGVSPERVTDVAAKAITDEQLQNILATCQSSSGVPGINEDCLTDSSAPLPPCTMSDTLCIATGGIADLNFDVVQVIDGRPGRPACSGEGGELCAGIVGPAGPDTDGRSGPSGTESGSTPTEETEPPTEPTPTGETEPPAESTPAEEDAEPSGPGS